MKIFIPESIIYFYVFCGDALINSLYGTVDKIIVESTCYYYSSNIFDCILFSENKIQWGPAWKGTYFNYEAPFFRHLAINDRFNWGYDHTVYKLLIDKHNSLFIPKFASIKGFNHSANKYLFLFNTYITGKELIEISNYGIEALLGDYIFSPIVENANIIEGYSYKNDWNHIAHIIFFFKLDYCSWIYLRVFDNIFAYIFSYFYIFITIMIHGRFLIIGFLTLLLFILIWFFKYFIYLENALSTSLNNVLDLIYEFEKLLDFNLKKFSNVENKTLYNFFLSILNFIISYDSKFVNGHSKFFVLLISMKRYLFKMNYNFIIFTIFFILKRIYEMMVAFSAIPFYLYELFFWNLRYLSIPLKFFVSKYSSNYLGLFKRQLNIWFFVYLNYIVSDLRDSSVSSSVFGWIRWMQISSNWDDFVESQWKKIIKYRENIIEKQEEKLKRERDKFNEQELNLKRVNLKTQGLDDKQIEDILYYEREKKNKDDKKKERKIRYKSKSYKEYMSRYSKVFKSVPVNRSSAWSKLYNLFLLKYSRKIVDLHESDLKMDRTITDEFIKEMSYYNWLMERKYLLLKNDYGYYDYLYFMQIQETMLVYYVETAQLMGFFSGFFDKVGYLFDSDNSYNKYTNYYFKFFISSSAKIHLGVSRFNYKNFIFENFYYKAFIANAIKVFKTLTFTSYMCTYMLLYIWFFAYLLLSFFKFFIKMDYVLLWYYFLIVSAMLKKKNAIIYNFFFIIIDFITNMINSLLAVIKWIFYLRRYIYVIYMFFVDAFSDSYYWIKVILFNIWFYFHNNGFILLNRFKAIIIFFIFLYVATGIAPPAFFSSLIAPFFQILFNCGYYFSTQTTILFNLKLGIIWFMSLNLYCKIQAVISPFAYAYLIYLKNMFFINIFVIFPPIIDYSGRILIFPISAIFNYTPYSSVIISWTWYDFQTLKVLDYLIKQEFSRELIWRTNHFFKSLFGGVLFHPIYRFFKNDNGEIYIFIKYLWYGVFHISYKLQISVFLFRLPCYIFVFPYWALRYGSYYILWQYLSFGVDGRFLLVSKIIICSWLYVRWHIFGWFITIIGLFTVYPSMLFMVYFDYILVILLKFNLCMLLYPFFVIILCLKDYCLIFLSWGIVEYIKLNFHSLLFYIEILLKFFFWLYLQSVGVFKFIVHFFQCVIPYIRLFYKYDVFFYFFCVDIFKSIVGLLNVIFILLISPFLIVWSLCCSFFIIQDAPVLGTFLGTLSEFLYKYIFYPYFIVYLDGFFDYYGSYGLRKGGFSNCRIHLNLGFVDVVNVMITNRDYLSIHRRWALAFTDGYNNLDYGFSLRAISNREIGAATMVFQLYIWLCYIIYIFVICIVFSGFGGFLRHKDNVFVDSAYLWYRLTSKNKITSFSRDELLWLTQNKWLFSFKSINGIFVDDQFDKYNYKKGSKSLGKLALKFIKDSKRFGYLPFEKKNDFNKQIEFLLSYSTVKFNNSFKIYDKNWRAIRYLRVSKKVEKLFKFKVFSKIFASNYLKSVDFKLFKSTKVRDLYSVSEAKRFWDYWLGFAVPFLIFSNYSYGTLKRFDKNFDLNNYLKALKLMLLHKDDKFKDLHDFYFLEHEFYNDLNDAWLWSKHERGSLLRSIVGSRYANRMVYSSKYLLNKNVFNKVYIEYYHNYLDKIIGLSDFDSNYSNNLINFRLHNILTSDRIVETQLTAKEIEKRVLEDYTDFMETGWEQDRMEDGQLAVYRYLSDRLHESFIDNEQDDTFDDTKLHYGMFDLSNKLSLRNFYTPFPDHWLALSVILPLILAIFLYKFLVVFSCAAAFRRPSYIYELCFFFVYFIYYLHPHFFFVTMASSFMFFPKLFKRRRKLRTFSPSRLSSVIENFFPNNELFRLIVNYSAFTPVFFFIKPAMDLLIFYIIFVVLIIIFFKFISDFDII